MARARGAAGRTARGTGCPGAETGGRRWPWGDWPRCREGGACGDGCRAVAQVPVVRGRAVVGAHGGCPRRREGRDSSRPLRRWMRRRSSPGRAAPRGRKAGVPVPSGARAVGSAAGGPRSRGRSRRCPWCGDGLSPRAGADACGAARATSQGDRCAGGGGGRGGGALVVRSGLPTAPWTGWARRSRQEGRDRLPAGPPCRCGQGGRPSGRPRVVVGVRSCRGARARPARRSSP